MPIEEGDFRHPGRWILSPKRGARFVGRHQRARLRARERRRQVYLFLLELIGLTGLIGMFPPLRGMLLVTGFFAVLLGVYTFLVVWTSRRPALARPRAVEEPTILLSLPEARPDPFLEEQDRRVVRVAH